MIGPPEALKTVFAWITALVALREHGVKVATVDFESGPRGTRRVLEDLGATPDELASIYYVTPDCPPTGDDIERITEAGVGLVIIDAAAGAFHASDLDDNKRADAERFAQVWVTPFWQRGITTIVIDHVVKNLDSRGRFAIGSERKVGAADVVLSLEAVEPLTRGGDGLVTVSVLKDRPAFLRRPVAAEIDVRSDPDTHAITWTFRDATAAATTTDWLPTEMMDHAVEFLRGQTEPVPYGRVEDAIFGKREVPPHGDRRAPRRRHRHRNARATRRLSTDPHPPALPALPTSRPLLRPANRQTTSPRPPTS